MREGQVRKSPGIESPQGESLGKLGHQREWVIHKGRNYRIFNCAVNAVLGSRTGGKIFRAGEGV